MRHPGLKRLEGQLEGHQEVGLTRTHTIVYTFLPDPGIGGVRAGGGPGVVLGWSGSDTDGIGASDGLGVPDELRDLEFRVQGNPYGCPPASYRS